MKTERKTQVELFFELSKSKALCPHDGMCIIFFINHDENNMFLPILHSVQRTHPKFHVMWVDRKKEKSFEGEFLGSTNKESVVFYNSKRSKFALMEDIEWTETSVSLFIDKATSGDINWKKLDRNPLELLQ